MSPRVEFHFDFGSPNAYFCHKVLPAFAARTGVQIAYVPVLLGGVFKLTNNQPPMVQFKGIKNKGEYARRETERFIHKHGLTGFRSNPHFPVNTVTIMRGAIVARDEGFLPRYADTMFAGMWEQGRKMDDPEVIRATLAEAGLDAAHLLARVQEQPVKDALAQSTQAAVERGIFGCPTFFVGDDMFFGKDRLAQVEEALA